MAFPRPLTFRAKLTFIFFLLVLSLSVIFVLFARSIFENEERSALELRATSLVSLLGESATNPLYDLRFDQLGLMLKNIREQPQVLYAYAYDVDGKVLADGTTENRYFNTILNDPYHSRAVKAERVVLQYKREALLDAGNMLDAAQPAFLPNGQKLGGVRIGFSLLPVQQKVTQAQRHILFLGLIFAFVGWGLSALLGKRLVRPIEHLVRGTHLIASGNLDVNIPVSARDELGMLADSFNRMTARLKENQAELQRKVVETRALYEVGQEIAAHIALEPTLQLIVDRARTLLQADVALLALRQPESDDFAVRAYSGVAIAALATLRFRSGEGLGGRVAASGMPMVVGDYLAEFRDSPFLQIVQEANLRSQVGVPLKAHNTVIGVLYVSSRAPHQFHEQDRELLSALADQGAIAIENAKLYEDVRRHAEELEAKVEARTRELQEANKRLQSQQIQLEIASGHKSQFLASMSHELRTPLNAVLGYTELILDNIYGEVPANIRDILQRVQTSGRHLLGLINDVLDLSKIEAGKFTLSLQDYSLKEIVQAVAAAVEALAVEKKLALRVTVPPDLPRGRGDERRIVQVLLNLVGNAIKFTEAGEVRVQATVSDGQFLVVVSDTGPGISEADQQKIFEEFQQVDSASTRQKGGTGLGLPIAKKIIELHGGRMWVESTPGKGSTFSFTLPVRVEQFANL